MEGGLYGLSLKQHVSLTACIASPIGLAAYGMQGLQDGLATLLLLQVCYVILPLIYIKFISKEGEITAYFINEFRTKSQQIKQGISLCGSAFGMVLFSYVFTYFFDEEVSGSLNLPLSKDLSYLMAFMTLFVFINPCLEEVYWRIFLSKTYQDYWLHRLWTNGAYMLMHFVILMKVFDNEWQMAMGFSTYFYSVSKSFEYIRIKYGLITCLMTHYGMTMASFITLAYTLEKLEQ